MKFRLTIVSEGDGWNSRVDETAEAEISEGVAKFRYTLDGDDCELTVGDAFVRQSRKGSVPLKLTFRPRERTLCIVGDESLCGGYEIYTQCLSVTVAQFGCRADMTYLSGKDKEKIHLKIAATAILERRGE